MLLTVFVNGNAVNETKQTQANLLTIVYYAHYYTLHPNQLINILVCAEHKYLDKCMIQTLDVSKFFPLSLEVQYIKV